MVGEGYRRVCRGRNRCRGGLIMPTIVAKDRKDAARIASKLLRAAGAEGHLVRTITAGRVSPAFDVPQSVYDRYIAGEGDKGEVEQAAAAEAPSASTDNGVADAEQADAATDKVEADAEADAELVEQADAGAGVDADVPDRNASTAEWAEYMSTRYGLDTEGMTRTALIAAYDEQ